MVMLFKEAFSLASEIKIKFENDFVSSTLGRTIFTGASDVSQITNIESWYMEEEYINSSEIIYVPLVNILGIFIFCYKFRH